MSVVNFWVDATILAAMLLLIWESATLQFIFPAPTLAGGWTLFGLTYDQCRDIQFATLCTFAFRNPHPCDAALELGLLGHRNPDSP